MATPAGRGRNGPLEAGTSRRAVLRGGTLAVGGIAAAALLGCSSDNDGGNSETATTAGTQAGAMPSPGRGQLIKDDTLPYPYQFPEPDKAPKPGGVMVIGSNADISIFDPTKTTASGTGRIVNMVYNRLIGFKRGIHFDPFKVELEPELAKSWERSPDGRVVTFKIRDDVKWQNVSPLNGRALVAGDVKFAFERYQAGGVNTSYWVGAERIEAPDDATLKVTLKKPLVDFLTPLASAYQTIHPRELVDSGEIEQKVIGTGPMILREAIPAQRVIFEKNPDYWEYPILLDGVELRIQVDTPARLAAFRAGQTDYADLLVTTTADAEALVETNSGTQINNTSTVNATPFAMNLSNPKFADVRVRRAISMGIDRRALAALVYPGLGKALPLFPWIFVMDQEPSLDSFGQWQRHNPEEAKALLSAAGFDGLELNNIYYPYSSAFEQTNDVLVDQLRAIGVTLTGGKAEYTEFNSQWTTRKLPEVSTGGWTTIGFDADNYFYNCLHSTAAGNRWNLNDPKMDELASRQQVELDPAARREIQREIWDYDLDQAYHPVGASGSGFQVYQPWLRGIRFNGALQSSNNYQDVGDMLGDAWLDK